jgi:hypothetical protein
MSDIKSDTLSRSKVKIWYSKDGRITKLPGGMKKPLPFQGERLLLRLFEY